MASSSNGNGNLVDEFEEAFQICLQALTKQESSSGIDKDEIKLEVDQTTMKFIDLARQMEAFFLQKRFLLSSLKPELLVKEDNQDLKHEIGRKEELIKKHYDKIDQWKALLADQQTNYKHQPQNIQQPDIRGVAGVPNNPSMSQSVNPQMPMSGMGNPMQAQLQAQHMQQQQQMLQAQQLQQMQQMQVGAQQQMFIQQHQQQLGQQQQGMAALNRQGNPNSMISSVGGGLVAGNGANTVGGLQGNFNQSGNLLQGPLAYLEKTTSNIDLVGMGDGRR